MAKDTPTQASHYGVKDLNNGGSGGWTFISGRKHIKANCGPFPWEAITLKEANDMVAKLVTAGYAKDAFGVFLIEYTYNQQLTDEWNAHCERMYAEKGDIARKHLVKGPRFDMHFTKV